MKLSPELLIAAYMQGIFPMAHEDGSIYWYDPDPRAILPLDALHVPRSLRQTLRKGLFELRVDQDFRAVMQACAAPAPGRESSWINRDFVEIYTALHEMGFAHSVEAWQDGVLVGGLYGVALNGLFAGESMFSRATDASKVALVHLVQRLRAGGYHLLDTQFQTPHLARFGVVEIPREAYKQQLEAALAQEANFFPPGF